MKLFLRLAWRNIWRHRRRTLIVMLSIGLTLSMMMLYDGMIAGFEQAIYGNAIRVLGGNVQIHATGYLNEFNQKPLLPLTDDAAAVKAALAQPQVVAASRRINTGGLASNRTGAFAVGIIGIEPEQELPVSLIAEHTASGRYLTAADRDVLFIGKGLAEAMKVAVGDRFTLAGRGTHDQMRSRTMTIAGIYDVGMPDIEKRTVYLSLAEAQDLYNLSGQSTEIVVTLKQLGQEPGVVAALSRNLPGFEVTPWQTNFPELQSAIDRKGSVMDIFGVIILFIAGIGIFNMLMMAVYERTREIGVLGAMGMKPRQISLLFILEGAMIGLVGVAFGVALGLLMNGVLGQVGLDYSKFSSVTEYTALITGKVYSTLGLEKLPFRAITSVIIAILAALYPARQAALSEPAAALHYV
jgi:ABC-type lipoprotein release transport system permease subunit